MADPEYDWETLLPDARIGRTKALLYTKLKDHRVSDTEFLSGQEMYYIGIFKRHQLPANTPGNVLLTRLPAQLAMSFLNKGQLITFAKRHGVQATKSVRVNVLRANLDKHKCDSGDCSELVAVFHTQETHPTYAASSFPPTPITKDAKHRILTDIGNAFLPSEFEEEGCMVCGELALRKDMKAPDPASMNFDLLVNPLATAVERKTSSDAVRHIEDSILAPGCNKVCLNCSRLLQKGRVPQNALCNGLWIGEVPHELQNLTFAEQQLIAKVRHNRCVMRVLASKRGKMMANAVMFSNPTLKVYNTLPPAKDELSEILAFIWIGADLPKASDYARSPMLVRKTKVREALEWLRLNNPLYHELHISEENLNTYDLIDVPVTCDWRQTMEEDETHIEGGVRSVHGQEADGEGTTEGPCTFRVHGLSSERYEKMTEEELKLKALSHMHEGHDVLGIGHAEKPESMYDNPAAYPSMFPWLFPYGKGGLGNGFLAHNFGEKEHKRHLLMYYDKRFQTDLYFPLIAFNHVQIKGGVTGSFLMTKKANFDQISERMLTINPIVLKDVSKRVAGGERLNYYTAKTEEEKKCFKILDDLDHVGGHVKGSITTKKYMRNEIWSLTMHVGAPTWFITLSPADVKHPLCLYYAGEKMDFSPDLRSSTERNYLISKNPVAAARFFHYMVQVFLKQILRADTDEEGIYGKTAAYYGTVEQQGRLTLHLHALVWIENAPSPQEIRDMLKGENGQAFGDRLREYLEESHRGQFYSGTLEEVKSKLPKTEGQKRRGLHDIIYEEPEEGDNTDPDYIDPTQSLPTVPPKPCEHDFNDDCDSCVNYHLWPRKFESIVDDLVCRSNIHTHHSSRPLKAKKQGTAKGALFGGGGCLNEEGVCSARFPREVIPETTVNYEDGTIAMKHLEPMLNAITGIVTWTTRLNTDVSSLLSGTALQAAISYITDYITKPSLKTHHVLAMLNDLFHSKLQQVMGSDSESRQDSARKLILSIVNALTAKLEIGSPMAAMYLLGNPDHYTGHEFILFWWRLYVQRVLKVWNQEDDDAPEEKVIVTKDDEDGEYVSYHRTDDYAFRPVEFDDIALVEWIRCSTKRKVGKEKLAGLGATVHDIGNGWWRLHPDHPQYATHVVRYAPSSFQSHVLNYVGGVLPRRDKGDREYYCCTMLAFFKPWRSGLDLKQDTETWDDAFSLHQFEDWMKRRMSNFNLKYECYDARHDYYHIRKRMTNAAKRQRGGSDPRLGEEDEFFNEADWVNAPPEDYFDENDEIGVKHAQRELTMREAERVLRTAGWMEQASGKVIARKVNFEPEARLSPAQWRATVAETRAKILKRKQDEASAKDSGGKRSIRLEDVNRVVVLHVEDYMSSEYKIELARAKTAQNALVLSRNLNTEQERAFRIVAEHAMGPQERALRMFLTGMGGTGKSQVIKALVAFFEAREESYRFILLAPTGTAASLIGGSTYHSVFGLRSAEEPGGGGSESTNLRKLRSNLLGVEYIFIDEVSMISAKSMYQISAKLAKGTGEIDVPFGGMNVIFAGDFAQLPPVKAVPVYRIQAITGKPTPYEQELQIGRAVWLQVTTVVKLTQNMRQSGQTDEDRSFRTALENMRYGACTADDIAFLKSRTVGYAPGRPRLTDPRFRDVAVITSWNAQKDRINELGSARFAEDTGQELSHFYSIDSLSPETDQRRKGHIRPPRLGERTKKALWDAAPCNSNQFAGKLSICLGLPVVIRHNDATELCITKGQNGTVYGWESGVGPDNQPVLDVLYIELADAPRTIKIPGLPDNVIPMTRTKRALSARLPNDRCIGIVREQVEVLPFFACTAHSAQGKTRENNVVDLRQCGDHFSYYTCLSRGTSAAGTCIIQGIDSSKITQGIDGFLRQEFREEDILNEITRLIHEKRLPKELQGSHRHIMIKAYRDYIAKNGALGVTRPEDIKVSDEKEIAWSLTDEDKMRYEKEKQKAEKDGKGAAPPPSSANQRDAAVPNPVKAIKRKGKSTDTAPRKRPRSKKDQPTKMLASDGMITYCYRPPESRPRNKHLPDGLRWDDRDYSCAYDSMMTVLWNLWRSDTDAWCGTFSVLSDFMDLLGKEFTRVAQSAISLEAARDKVRAALSHTYPSAFPYGHKFTAISCLRDALFQSHFTGHRVLSCGTCRIFHQPGPRESFWTSFTLTDNNRFHAESTGRWFNCALSRRRREQCPNCRFETMWEWKILEEVPQLLCVDLVSPAMRIDHMFSFVNGVQYRIIGVIYFANHHFTCRFVDEKEQVWYHDGRRTAERMEFEGPCHSRDLRTCNITGGSATQAMYARVS